MKRKTSPSTGPGSASVTGFYDEPTGSICYVAADPQTGRCAIVDPVLGFDPAAARTETGMAEALLEHVRNEGLSVEWILDTHPHADHVTASDWLRGQTGAKNAIGARVPEIADLWRDFYNMPGRFDVARDYDRLFADGDSFAIGDLPVRVMLTAGHTLGSLSYVVGSDAAFVADTFMQPDAGTARADFPGGSAATLYRSLMAIVALPENTRLFVGHDYGTDARDEPEWESTVARQKGENIHIGGGVSCEDYVARRRDRDKTLGLPDRMLHALQLNLRAGRFPDPEDDGHSYLKIPLNRF